MVVHSFFPRSKSRGKAPALSDCCFTLSLDVHHCLVALMRTGENAWLWSWLGSHCYSKFVRLARHQQSCQGGCYRRPGSGHHPWWHVMFPFARFSTKCWFILDRSLSFLKHEILKVSSAAFMLLFDAFLNQKGIYVLIIRPIVDERWFLRSSWGWSGWIGFRVRDHLRSSHYQTTLPLADRGQQAGLHGFVVLQQGCS